MTDHTGTIEDIMKGQSDGEGKIGIAKKEGKAFDVANPDISAKPKKIWRMTGKIQKNPSTNTWLIVKRLRKTQNIGF
jgi:hypothetical protein